MNSRSMTFSLMNLDSMNLCPICSSFKFSQFRFGLIVCNNCSAVFNKLIWNDSSNIEMTDEWFGEDFSGNINPWEKIFERHQNRRTYNRLFQYLSSVKTLLEVGVGSGSLLAYYMARGVNVEGCDLSGPICEYVRDKYKIDMHNCFLSEIPENKKYDAIIMNHVLEHVNDPLKFIKDARSHLYKGGIIHLAVPNIFAWEAKFSGWVGYAPYHLIYFSPQTLQLVLEKSGFSIIQISHHDSFSGWFITLLRTALGLYYKNSNQKNKKKQKRQGLVANIYRTLMVLCGFLTWPMRYLQKLFGRGDEVIIIAEMC